MALSEWKNHWMWKLGGARPWVAKQLNLKENMKLLDVGTGDGLFCIQAGKLYKRIEFIGIEYSDEAKEAKENILDAGLKNCKVLHINAYKLKCPYKYDRIVFFNSLRNIPTNKTEMIKLLKVMNKYLKEDGILAIADMFKEDAKNKRQRLAQEIYADASKYNTEHTGVETFFNKKDVNSALRIAGFKIDTIKKFKTGVKLNINQTKRFIKDEAEDNWSLIWERFKEKIEKMKGIEPDANLSLILAHK